MLKLETPFEKEKGIGWADIHPTPQFARKDITSLCGKWELYLESEFLGDIEVPFPPESRISGIGRALKDNEKYIYKKSFELSPKKGRVLLHFGAVDQIGEVTLNGTDIGMHEGGYLPFVFDITKHLKESENTLTVTVTDDLDSDLPYGKQRKKRGGMWYTPISGIWQQVWLECVPEKYIKGIKITPSLTGVEIEVDGGEDEKTLTLKDGREFRFVGKRTFIEIEKPRLWSPSDPYLYEFTLCSGEDIISSYFALRTVEVGFDKPCILLNGEPYFFHGLLDQGYFSDGIFMPASPSGFEYDVVTMKRLGFNTLRKHIKIEPELFYYYCDKHGMLVFQDMVNSGKYNYVRDTVLPTLGFKRRRERHASKRRAEIFERDAKETVSLLYNHPCVVYYTVFNEGWGQYDADRVYRDLKALDGTRIWDATSGWFEGMESDVISEHIYFRKVNLFAKSKPLVLSEFGGYSCKLEGHAFNLRKEYGYKKCVGTAEFTRELLRLYYDEIIPSAKRGLCAAILTQVSDIEDETNGLVTYDRQVIKVPEDKMRKLAKDLEKAFEEYAN